MTVPAATALLAFCRPGYEAETASELRALRGDAEIADQGVPGTVLLDWPAGDTLPAAQQDQLVFARAVRLCFATLRLADRRDRITPIVEACKAAKIIVGDVWVEFPDSDEGRPLSALARQLTPKLLQALAEAFILGNTAKARLYVVLLDSQTIALCLNSRPGKHDWPMGIPRLRVGTDAPSRSAAKIAEAFHTLTRGDSLERLLKPGRRAVDLGAAPGGWSWWLAQQGFRVTAVDNARLKPQVLATELVEHVRGDGFHYRPKGRVDWVVCDMIEKPRRIAELMAKWLGEGWTMHALFNLKLPMKKRTEELQHCRTIVEQGIRRAGGAYAMRMRQLYHNRDEVTVMVTQSPKGDSRR